jgi:hypothetical protein
VLGASGAIGHYFTGSSDGLYFRLGFGVGFEAGGGAEAGKSDSEAAFADGAVDAGLSAGPVGIARSWNKDGKTTSGSATVGWRAGFHASLTGTAIIPVDHHVDLSRNFDCSLPHPHNHVCNQ